MKTTKWKNKKLEQCLIDKGFKKKYLDDKSGYWFELKFKIGTIKARYIADDIPNKIFLDIKYNEEYITIKDDKLTVKNIEKWSKILTEL